MEWKQIQGYENYEVSNEGQVRNRKTGKILKPVKNSTGYLQVTLCKNKRKNYSIHRLVAEAFIPNPHGYDTVDHINYDKTDNRVENLRWMSRSNNAKDGSKMRATQKVYCVELDQTFNSINEAERETGIWRSNITACCQGKYKHAGGYHWKYVENK